MPDPKPTPQILRAAEVIRCYFEDGQYAPENPDVSILENDRRVDNDLASLMMQFTGAEMMEECRDELIQYHDSFCAINETYSTEEDHRRWCKLYDLLTRLASIYDKEAPDER